MIHNQLGGAGKRQSGLHILLAFTISFSKMSLNVEDDINSADSTLITSCPQGKIASGIINTSAELVEVSNAAVSSIDRNADYSVFHNLEDVDRYIMEQEIAQTTKFVLNRICSGFGSSDPGW